jgi:hypothetical protein
MTAARREEAAKFWALTSATCGRADWEEEVRTWFKEQPAATASLAQKSAGLSSAEDKGSNGGQVQPKT